MEKMMGRAVSKSHFSFCFLMKKKEFLLIHPCKIQLIKPEFSQSIEIGFVIAAWMPGRQMNPSRSDEPFGDSEKKRSSKRRMPNKKK